MNRLILLVSVFIFGSVNLYPIGVVDVNVTTTPNPSHGTCINVVALKAYNDVILQTPPSKLVIVKIERDISEACQFLTPGLNELAKKYADRCVFMNVDYMLVPEPFWQFNVTEVPSLFIWRGAKLIDSFVTTGKRTVEWHIEKALADLRPKL